MSTRTTLRPTIVLNAVAMASSQNSNPTILQSITKLCYTMSWSGSTPVGTASVQISNDYALSATGQVANSGTWTTIELNYLGSTVSSIPITGNTGTAAIEIDTLAAYACRLVYTAASGTGTLTAYVNGKVS